jgi:hypothetical protein
VENFIFSVFISWKLEKTVLQIRGIRRRHGICGVHKIPGIHGILRIWRITFFKIGEIGEYISLNSWKLEKTILENPLILGIHGIHGIHGIFGICRIFGICGNSRNSRVPRFLQFQDFQKFSESGE